MNIVKILDSVRIGGKEIKVWVDPLCPPAMLFLLYGNVYFHQLSDGTYELILPPVQTLIVEKK